MGDDCGMPVASSPSTSKRLLTLLSLLQSRRDWPAQVLADRLEVSERTVRRDVDRLRELDYAITATRGPDGGYRLAAGAHLPPLLLDDEQAVAIAIALRSAGALGAGIDVAAERALSTLARTMPSHLARRIESLVVRSTALPAPGDAATPDVLLRIGEAIRAGEELRFDYDSPDYHSPDYHSPDYDSGRTLDPGGKEPGSPSSTTAAPVRTTEPHHLLLHAGRWYLIGFSRERDDWRVYRVDRISPRSHNGRRFSPKPVPGGDPAHFLRARFKGSAGADTWPCWGEATVHAPIAGVAPYIGDGTVEARGDHLCRVRLGAWSWGALAATFARFDADITDVAPVELRRGFSQLAGHLTAAAEAPR